MKYVTLFTCDIIHGFLWELLMLVKRSWKRVCLLGGAIHGRSLAEDGSPEKKEWQGQVRTLKFNLNKTKI